MHSDKLQKYLLLIILASASFSSDISSVVSTSKISLHSKSDLSLNPITYASFVLLPNGTRTLEPIFKPSFICSGTI